MNSSKFVLLSTVIPSIFSSILLIFYSLWSRLFLILDNKYNTLIIQQFIPREGRDEASGHLGLVSLIREVEILIHDSLISNSVPLIMANFFLWISIHFELRSTRVSKVSLPIPKEEVKNTGNLDPSTLPIMEHLVTTPPPTPLVIESCWMNTNSLYL